MKTWSFFIAEPLAEVLGLTLLHSLWQGALIVGILAIWLRLRPDLSAAKRYLLALGGLAFLLFGMVGTAASLQAVAIVPPSTSLLSQAVFSSTWALLQEMPGIPYVSSWEQWLSTFWLIGGIIWALRCLGGWVYVQRLRYQQARILSPAWQHTLNQLGQRMGINQTLLLIESGRISSPMVIGHLRPVILLPLGLISGLSPQYLEAVLAHELAHIRRYDFLVNLLVRCMEIVLFYHPAYWWLQRMLETEREHACDDLAIRHSPSARVYVEALTQVASWQPMVPNAWAMGLAGTQSNLFTRIQRIMLNKSIVTPAPFWAIVVLGACLTLGGLYTSGNYLKAAPPPPSMEPITRLGPINDLIDLALTPLHSPGYQEGVKYFAVVPLTPPVYTLPHLTLVDSPPPPPPIRVKNPSRLRPSSPPPPPPLPAPATTEQQELQQVYERWAESYLDHTRSWADEASTILEQEKAELAEVRRENERVRLELERVRMGREQAERNTQAAVQADRRVIQEELTQAQQELKKRQIEHRLEAEMHKLEAELARVQATELADGEGYMAELTAILEEGHKKIERYKLDLAGQLKELKMFHETFLGSLKEELRADGLMARGKKRTEILMEGKRIKVNGRRLEPVLEAKYRSLFESAGFDLEHSSRIQVER